MERVHTYETLPCPAIFAHRGASAHAPENTLAAFRLALEQQADAIEFDVTLCASGEVVVIHDDKVDRTTNGHGKVRDLTLAALKSLDAGSFFSPDFNGEHIPTLREVLKEFGGRLFMNIELKTDITGMPELPNQVAKLVKEFGVEKQILISSFDLRSLAKINKLLPDTARAALAAPGLRGAWMYSRCFNALNRYEAVHPDVETTNRRLVAIVHKRRQRIHPYTVDDVHQIKQILQAGVDGFFTNNPLIARQVVQGYEH